MAEFGRRAGFPWMAAGRFLCIPEPLACARMSGCENVWDGGSSSSATPLATAVLQGSDMVYVARVPTPRLMSVRSTTDFFVRRLRPRWCASCWQA